MARNWFGIFATLKKWRGHDSGGALVEFALTMPVLTLLLAGSVELARIAYTSIEITNASRAAAQYGAQNSTTAADYDNSSAQNGGIQKAAAIEASGLNGVTTTVLISGMCSSGASCTGTSNAAGPTCKNTDCQTNSGDHIETILNVTSSITFSPGIQIKALPTTFTLSHTTVQKCLNC
ncbi:TadE/TadG family type IV pilus assembly protein [Telmatobacter sp. DSM 110680]|uniref:TadE/TadG family type IV pilus assembly protein n=1 Tax=Telmatobacter sp. DSM 110680 TaxID=3036704 RepID=A0AAU7DKE4_9BACT